MNIKLPVKIHNKFEIEVKDTNTGEVVQRGIAENIMLDNFFNDSAFATYSNSIYVGAYISYGEGTGILSPTRTTLFTKIGDKQTTSVEIVRNQAPLPSYATRKIVISPSEHVGKIFTEVGSSKSAGSATIYNHALIKDSEGNALALGPKTDTQEITIYRTVYFQPSFEAGVTLDYLPSNGLIDCGTFNSNILLGRNELLYGPRLFVNGVDPNTSSKNFYLVNPIVNGVISTNIIRIGTSEYNTKIKTLSQTYGGILLNLETLAENDSTIWSGYEFDNTPIGKGNGSQTIFNLTWDEAWLTKPYRVYVDGVEVTSGFTFNAGNITFDTAPANGGVITADYWIKYIPKDSDHVLDVQFSINFGEGAPS